MFGHRTPGRIALVCPRFRPAIGGIERHVEELATRLVARGYQVEVVTTDPSGQLPSRESHGGLTIRRFRIVGPSSYFVSPSLAWWLIRHASGFAVIHAHSYHTPLALAGLVAARLSAVPLIFTPHYHGTGHTALARALHVPYRPFGARVVRGARVVVCVSQVECTLIREHFGEVPAVVIPNGVDLPATNSEPPASEQGTSVLFVGRLDRYKQVDKVIDAISFLPSSHVLHIVGEGPEQQNLARAAARASVVDRVVFTGRVSAEELADLYRQAAVLVTLSLHEAFGLTILEAGVRGSRVVASDIPAHREVAAYLPDSIVSLVSPDASPREVARVIAAAVSLNRTEPPVETFSAVPSWDAMAARLDLLYRTAVSGAKSE